MKKIVIGAFVLFAAPLAASAQSVSSCSQLTGSNGGVAGVVSCIIGFFNIAVYLIMAAAVVYIVWGAFQLMREEKREEGKNIVLYGIVGLFVMTSIWGLVNILDRTFNLSNEGASRPPELIPGSRQSAPANTRPSPEFI